MIEVIVNGVRTSMPAGLNVRDAIIALKYEGKGFSLALNGTFVAIATYDTTLVNDNDSIEILAPVQGG